MTANELLASYNSGKRCFECANLPAPSMFLLASWGIVSDKLCQALMRFDAANHDDSGKFAEWSEGGECPYNNESYQRCANFSEDKKLLGI